MFIAGKPPKALIAALNHHFGGADWIGEHSAPFEYRLPAPQQALSIEVNKSGALQSAIRLGRRLFSKNHPDYFPLQVTNTLLGGYFGSRLMTNLREDKGLTYGIGSSVVPLRHSGYFFISTEVNADATAQALEEIYKEIGKLRETSPDAKELERVKNYLLGAFLRSVSGPFSQLEQLRSRLFFDLPENYIESFPKRLQAVTSDQVQEMANRYWQEAHLIQVVAGP
ncbi:MAG: M16 family metallopeptidase [Salibacteraceae bacterium]